MSGFNYDPYECSHENTTQWNPDGALKYSLMERCDKEKRKMIRKSCVCSLNYNELERELIEIANGFDHIPNTDFDENYK